MPITETTIRLGTGVPGCEDCGCGGGPFVSCLLCDLPPSDLIFTLVYLSQYGGINTTSFVLTYEAGGGSPFCPDPDIPGTVTPYWHAEPVIADYAGSGVLWHPSLGVPLLLSSAEEPHNFNFFCHPESGHFEACHEAPVAATYVFDDLGNLLSETPNSGLCLCTDDLLLSLEEACDPLCFRAEHQATPFPLVTGGGTEITYYRDAVYDLDHFVSETGDPPEPITICASVRRPGCNGSVGDPLSGIDVTIDPPGTIVATNASGLACFSVEAGGTYTLSAAPEECGEAASATVIVGKCARDIEVALVVCCAVACVEVVKDSDDSPIPDVEVTFHAPSVDPSEPGASILGTATTDASGIACLPLTTEQMLALPVGAGGCSSRRITATVLTSPEGTDFIVPRCETFEVDCGADGTSPQEFRVASLPPGYIISQAGSPPACCPDGGCGEIGPDNRAVTAAAADQSLELSFYDISNNLLSSFRVYNAIGNIDLAPFDADGTAIYTTVCLTGGAVTEWPTYLDPFDVEQSYQSAELRLVTCGEGAPFVRVRIWRGADCLPLDEFGEAPGANNDIELFIPLAEGSRLCHSDTIADDGMIGDDAYFTWMYDASPAASP